MAAACSTSNSETPNPTDTTAIGNATVWVTTGDKVKLLEKQNPVPIYATQQQQLTNEVTIDFNQKLQEVDGYGAALTGSAAYLIHQKLSQAQRASLLQELFNTDTGIGISYLRITMGASDFSLSNYTYNDLLEGETDPALLKFSISKDEEDIIPVLKNILEIQPNIKIMATPWSAPAWMKTSQKLGGGKLKPEWYSTYSDYFLKYLNAYKMHGITIDALSIQNEPLHEAAYPSMLMEAAEQTAFIKNHLGPKFQENGVPTKILIYDHNWDRPDYPISILDDPEARKFVAGTAFHAYGGNVSAMSTVHNKFGDKGVYFTEISGGRWATNFSDNLKWNMSNIFIGTANNWSKNALLWNLALDENDGPTNNGCDNCRGVVTINPNGTIVKNEEYYAIAHFSKFVRPGAVRVLSDKFSTESKLEQVTFLNPDDSKVMIVLNSGSQPVSFSAAHINHFFQYTMEAHSVATFYWK